MDNKTSRNIQKGEQQCKSIKESISKYRQEINQHVNHLEGTLFNEANTVWGQEKSKLSGSINHIEEKQKNLKEILDDMHKVTKHTAKFQSSLGLHQIEQKIYQLQKYVEDMENNKVDIMLNQNDEQETILSHLQLCKSFGDVKFVKTEISMNRELSLIRDAQVELRNKLNINNIAMNIETKIRINIRNYTGDMVCMMDGRVIVVEWNYKVNLLTSDGKVQKQLPIPCGVSSVTQINQNTLAISYNFKKAIQIFNIEKETITKVITLDKTCRGLAFSNNSLAVGLSCDEICIMDLEGNTLKKIKVSSKSYLENLVYFSDRLIYSDFHGEAVYCIGVSGTPIWEYKHLSIYRPFGLCTDIYGNVFVTDCYSHRIIVISKDGRDSKILLGEEDGLYHPKCICLKDNESYGFICDDIGRHFTKFNIAYE